MKQLFVDALAAGDYPAAKAAYLSSLEGSLFGALAKNPDKFAAALPQLFTTFDSGTTEDLIHIVLNLAFCHLKVKEFKEALQYYQVIVDAYSRLPVTDATSVEDIRFRLLALEGLIESQQAYGNFLELTASFTAMNAFINTLHTSYPQWITEDVANKITYLKRLESIGINLITGYTNLQLLMTQSITSNDPAVLELCRVVRIFGNEALSNNIPAFYLKTRIYRFLIEKMHLMVGQSSSPPIIDTDISVKIGLERFVSLLLNMNYDQLMVTPPEITKENFELCEARFQAFNYFGKMSETSTRPFFDHVVAPYITLIKKKEMTDTHTLKLIKLVSEVAGEYGKTAFTAGDFKLVLHYFQLVLKWSASPLAGMHYNEGRCYMKLQQYAKARSSLIKQPMNCLIKQILTAQGSIC